MLSITRIQCNQKTTPTMIDHQNPKFSWTVESDDDGTKQYSYEIQISDSPAFSKLYWDSNEVISNQTHLIAYAGQQLQPDCTYFLRVRLTDTDKITTHWVLTSFNTALMLANDRWPVPFISPIEDTEFDVSCGWYLMHSIKIEKPVQRVVVYASALGMYELYINGKRAGKQEFSPGWTDYKRRLQYQWYDVTALIEPGENLLMGHLGTGWYKGDLGGWLDLRGIYGSRNWFSMLMHIEYEDAVLQTVSTDEKWKSCRSPVLYSEIYHGEVYDAQQQRTVQEIKRDLMHISSVVCEKKDSLCMVYQEGPEVLEQEIIKPVAELRDSKGRIILDFGQNITGQVRFSVTGNAGECVRLYHGEILDQNGDLYTENLRTAKQKIEYLCRGDGTEIWKPHFTFQGFRYVLIDKFSGEYSAERFEAIVYHSDMDRTGHFSCSDSRVNKLFKNIVWGMKGNFLDIPTDCPQRDERLGWTGDAQVFINTACRLYDTGTFFQKWLADMRSEQHADGGIPHVIPDIFESVPEEKRSIPSASATGWADAAVICPWELYLQYGNTTYLSENYDMMRRWVSYMEQHATDKVIWDSGFHFGDWLALDGEPGSYFGATPNDLTATAFYANSVKIMEKIAAVLHRVEDETYYHALHDQIAEAFCARFLKEDGSLTVQTQTAHVLALHFELIPERFISGIIDNLVVLIEKAGMHLNTGFLGTPYLCDVLTNHGRCDIAYQLLLQDTFPSWLYQVKHGATTIWEHWDGIKPDGSLWSPDMNSFNHYAYGSIGAWLMGKVAGINTSEQKCGYHQVCFTPHPMKGLEWVSASQETPYGKVSLQWEMKDDTCEFIVTIPIQTTGTLQIPQTEEILDIKPGISRFRRKIIW